MKTAIPHWQGRISPVYDVARSFLLFAGGPGDREALLLSAGPAHERAAGLAEAGVVRLICGAISQRHRLACQAVGIAITPGICGDVEAVIRACIEGALSEERFRMPGCCRRRRRRHRGARDDCARQP
ncbi:MAG: NifB/NifX family molybdenum-iron cluster-binding protein [Planctomycetota bacterium]